MTSTLPPIPRFIFTVFEPLSLFAGWLGPTFSTEHFVSAQLPSIDWKLSTSTWPTTQVLALQLGNVYGLLALIGVGVLYQTTEAKVVRNFLIACAIGDLGHLYVIYAIMGDDFWKMAQWNAVAWGNMGATGSLFIIRCLYFMGVFGKDRVVEGTDLRAKRKQ